MEREEVHAVVENFVRQINDSAHTEVPLTAPLDELGIDSLSMVDLLFKLEREFAVSIPDEAIPGISTVGDLMNLVAQQR